MFLLEIKCSDLALFSSTEFSLGGVAVACVKKEQKFQTKPLKNIPEIACFGWISPTSSIQAGGEDLLEKYGCGRGPVRGEDLEILGVLGGEQILGVLCGGKSDVCMGRK